MAYTAEQKRFRDAMRTQVYALRSSDLCVTIDYYTIAYGAFDPITGENTVSSKNCVTIRNALLLPIDWKTQFKYDLSFIAANKNFTYGSLFERGDRALVLDGDSVTDISLTANYVVVQQSVYAIRAYQDLGFQSAYFVHLRETQSVSAFQLIKRTIFSSFEFEQTIAVVKES